MLLSDSVLVVDFNKMADSDCVARAADCTMHIPISDRDYACAKHVLPHQMRVIGKYASDVLISVNRFEAPKKPEILDSFLSDLASKCSNVRVEEVDYSETGKRWVRETFFGGEDYPFFDYDGIPIHAFIEPFRHSRHKHFFRLDSDMMLGGSGPWIDEAIEVLNSDKLIAAINPLAGPRHSGRYHSQGIAYPVAAGEAFKVENFTTRTMFVELDAFFKLMNPLKESLPRRLKDRIYARVAGYPVVDHLEILYQRKMLESNSYRVDMGGSGGLWTLHPIFKTPQFLNRLPDIINRVESGDLPQIQYGRYDLHGRVFDQTDTPSRSAQAKRLISLAHERFLLRRDPGNLRSGKS